MDKPLAREGLLEQALWSIHRLAHLNLVRRTDPPGMPQAMVDETFERIRLEAHEALLAIRVSQDRTGLDSPQGDPA